MESAEMHDTEARIHRGQPCPILRSGAQRLIGEMYAFGQGVPKNDSEAIYWFRRPAIDARGETDPAAAAQLAVAKSYAEGIGVKAEAEESAIWRHKAAEGGSREAAELENSHDH